MLVFTDMSQNFQPGDFLVFQVDSGFVLLRVLNVDRSTDPLIWHVAAYRDIYFDVDSAEQAAASPAALKVELPHAALTNRAFESTQVSRLLNIPLTADELANYHDWKAKENSEVSDRSIRLILGLR